MQETSKTFSLRELFTHVKPATNIAKLLSLGFGIILISWLLAQLEWKATFEILRNVPISLLFFGFLCYAASFYLRAARFKLLLPQNKQIAHLFPIVLVHYTALNIIPARLGELSYVYLLKKVNNISTGYSLASLVLARVFDQIAISFLFLISLGFVTLPSHWLKNLSLLIGGLLITTCGMLLLILAYKEKCVLFLKHCIRMFGWDRYNVVQRVIHEIEGVVAAFRESRIKNYPGKILGTSLVIWISIFSLNYLLLKAFHVHLSYVEVILTSTVIILLTVLPLQILSGFGIRETTWVFIAMTLGVPRRIAITAVLGTRIISTIFLCLFCLYGLWRLQDSFNHPLKKT
ncbi:MAG: flippase-like domain-containing protein [Deltaproteobacteria bacterium]|nr:flippase-like domain-containing protein [Deltaproteobacteria bacterium]